MRASSWKLGAAVAVVALLAPACGDDDVRTRADGGGGSGDAGSDAGGRPGDAGSDAGVPTGPLDPARAARAATVFGSCIPDDGVNRFLHALYAAAPDDYYAAREALECLADATDGCAATERCLGARFTLGDPAGCAPRCDGSHLVVCDDTWHFDIDCAFAGLVCDVGERACVAPDRTSCTPDGTSVARCDGGRPVVCEDTGFVRAGLDCASHGLTCADIPGLGEGGCVGEGARCETGSVSPLSIEYPGTGCADAAHLDACVNGRSHVLACAEVAAGFGCQHLTDADGDAFFCGLGSACRPGVEDETCDGTSLVICLAGRTERIDCTALGFSGCGPHPELGIAAGCTP